MIRIKENKKPNIEKIKFECDEEIHSKLNEYELTRDFLNKSNTTIFIGRQGSGKTSLMVNIVKKLYKKCFHFIYVFMPHSSRKSLKNNIFDKYLDPSQIYEELNSETIDDLYIKLKNNSEEGCRSLVIFDDVQKALKDHSVLISLKNIIANQRHLKCTNIILLQNYYALDKSLRELANNIIMFKLNKSQTEKIFNEAGVESAKDKFSQIRDLVFDKPYTWLFINLPSQRIFKEFDEIIYNDNDTE
jgi:predicted ATP-binding protein involved in virulence